MKTLSPLHNFHIPVMGIGFTIDTPIKVAPFGISSVVSLVDDILIEKMREFYSEKFDLPFQAITNKIEDFRSKRITAYLDVLDKIVKEKHEKIIKMIEDNGNALDKYISMLPDISSIKKTFLEKIKQNKNVQEVQQWLQKNLNAGSIDVNIMTKLDKDNFAGGEKLAIEYNDAHAALRGFANSSVASSLVLSAGMNPKLYSYIENFEGFYPDETGYIKKKITLKTSDYRSALIQGKFLAKKGLWVSEFRIESGLNCGGHAFATDGYLMGPILEELKQNRTSLQETLYELFSAALKDKQRHCPEAIPEMKISAQGGVGTVDEHQLLLEHYQLDSIGWGSPFLLVPEATSVDAPTLQLLCDAKEDDLYLSGISPLGVPFNTVKGNTKEIERQSNLSKNRPGSACPKEYVAMNKEFEGDALCIASRKYQHLKIQELNNKHLPEQQHKKAFDKIVEKSCICVGLGTSALLVNNLDTKTEGSAVSICPGPNMAYFSQPVSLERMVDHIYGRDNIITHNDRPHMFLKELDLYMKHLEQLIQEYNNTPSAAGKKVLLAFDKNMHAGISYYKELFTGRQTILTALAQQEQKLHEFINSIIPD
ncbi:hypothetical protein ACI6Q2_07700 [Chitinophagaceae bacterium LWZ2-11]